MQINRHLPCFSFNLSFSPHAQEQMDGAASESLTPSKGGDKLTQVF